MSRRQLVVTYHDHTIMWYSVGPDRSWRIDNPSRCIIIGHGLPRTYIPLDTVRSFDIAVIDDDEAPA